MTNQKKVEQIVESYGNDLAALKKAIKAVQSRKCLHLKKKGLPNYQAKLDEILREEQYLKEAIRLLDPKEKTTTEFTQEDVSKLDYDQTIKAIRSIQSKKTHTRWKTTVEGDNDEYRAACKIERMLLEHKEAVKPVEEAYIRKTELQAVIDTIESSGSVSQERIVEMLKGLL